jgi:hypothetical protein
MDAARLLHRRARENRDRITQGVYRRERLGLAEEAR